MLRTEFEKLTGHYPSNDLYKAIEEVYNAFEGDKYAFCNAYKTNEGGLAEKIQCAADVNSYKAYQNFYKDLETAMARIKELESELEKEEEWKMSTDSLAALKRYQELKAGSNVALITEEKAADLVSAEFAFDRSRVRIITELCLLEVNRHGRTRKKKKESLAPFYESTDWNYVRFSAGAYTYEMVNGELLFVE